MESEPIQLSPELARYIDYGAERFEILKNKRQNKVSKVLNKIRSDKELVKDIKIINKDFRKSQKQRSNNK